MIRDIGYSLFILALAIASAFAIALGLSTAFSGKAWAQFNPRHEFDNVPISLCPTLYRQTEGQNRADIARRMAEIRRTIDIPRNLEYAFAVPKNTEACIARVLEALKVELAGTCTADPFLRDEANAARVRTALQSVIPLCVGGPYYGPSATEFITIPPSKLTPAE